MAVNEVEIKAVIHLGDDLDEMERRVSAAEKNILEKGGVFRRVMEQMDIYFSHPARDFSKTDEAFRIRVEDAGRVKFTYKGPKISERSKSRLEKEVEVEIYDLDGLRELFTHLGFNEVMSVIKTRKVFDLDGIEVDLDYVTGLGIFCEMEIVSEDVAGAEDRIIASMNEIGWTELERRSYLELLLEKQF